jgi:hypothetical protein
MKQKETMGNTMKQKTMILLAKNHIMKHNETQ